MRLSKQVPFLIDEVPGGWLDIYWVEFLGGTEPYTSFLNPTPELKAAVIAAVLNEDVKTLNDLWDSWGLEDASEFSGIIH